MFIKKLILFSNSADDKFFNIIALVVVSGNPPLLDIITAHPFADASKLVLPKGSSHLEQTTAICVFLNILITFLCSKKPKFFTRLWLRLIFSLLSSPITNDSQFLFLFKTFTIALANMSYPFARFSFPTKVIIFFFFLIILKIKI